MREDDTAVYYAKYNEQAARAIIHASLVMIIIGI